MALPVEHGGWGFLFEALIVGLAVAPSASASTLALAAIGVFLARHPLKLLLSDWMRGRSYPRTRWAAAFFVLYGAVALLGLGLAVAEAEGALWPPLLAAAGLALVQLHYDVRSRGRELSPELLGACAPGAIASAMALGRGWAPGPAMALWLILAARAVASILYVRARLRLDRGQPHETAPVWACHVGGLALVAALALAGRAPWLTAVAFVALLARAAHGLSPYRRPLRPQALGMQELGLGLLSAALIALGYVLTT